jgi:hypothetical protein
MQKQIFSQKKVIIPIILAVVLAILFFAGKPALDRRNSNKNTDNTSQQSGTDTDSNTVSPIPSEDPDNQKDRNLERDKIDQSRTPTPTPTGDTGTTKAAATPVITYAGQQGENLEVGGIITGVYESGGSCTVTVSKGTYVYTKTQQAIKNATTTDCQYFIIPLSDITESGTVQVSIKYDSPTAAGVSEQKAVTIE